MNFNLSWISCLENLAKGHYFKLVVLLKLYVRTAVKAIIMTKQQLNSMLVTFEGQTWVYIVIKKLN